MPALEAVRELERLSAWTQYQKGLTPQWARPMTPAEVKSRCNFAALDRIMRKAYTDAAQVLDTFRQAIIQDLRRTVGHITDPKELSKVLAAWSMDASPGVRQARALAVGAMHSVLLDAAQQSGRQLMQEARAQGVTVDPSLPVVVKAAAGDPFSEDSADALLGEAQSPVAAVENKLTAAAISESQRPGSADDPVKKVEDTSIGSAVDLASQGVHIASGEGRSAAADVLPDAQSWYASELNDGNTCGPCSDVDGTEYASLDEAEQDYPASGPYKNCDGDARCRGTLVAVWGEQPSGEPPPEPDAPDPDVPPEPPVEPLYKDESEYGRHPVSVSTDGVPYTFQEKDAQRFYADGWQFSSIKQAFQDGEQYVKDGVDVFSGLRTSLEKTSLTTDGKLYRGMQVSQKWLDQVEAGSTIEHPFYASTSTDPTQAVTYGLTTRPEGYRDAKLEILTPAGTHVIPGSPDLHELVLGPGSRMKVRRFVDVEGVPAWRSYRLIVVDLVG